MNFGEMLSINSINIEKFLKDFSMTKTILDKNIDNISDNYLDFLKNHFNIKIDESYFNDYYNYVLMIFKSFDENCLYLYSINTLVDNIDDVKYKYLDDQLIIKLYLECDDIQKGALILESYIKYIDSLNLTDLNEVDVRYIVNINRLINNINTKDSSCNTINQEYSLSEEDLDMFKSLGSDFGKEDYNVK